MRAQPRMTPRARARHGPPVPAGAGSDADQGGVLAAWLDAIPLAWAAFTPHDGVLFAANHRHLDEFSTLPGFARRADLLATLQAGNDEAPQEVQAPHSNRWYALHWRGMEQDGRELSLLTAIDISERIEALDSHKRRQEKLLFTSQILRDLNHYVPTMHSYDAMIEFL